QPTSLLLLARDKLGLDRQLGRRQRKRLLGRVLIYTFHLEEDAARLDHCHPAFGRTFAFAHTSLCRLLGDRLVVEDADPQLATTLDVARDGDTTSFNLATGDPRYFHRLQRISAESDLGAALRRACAPPALLLAILDLFRSFIFSHFSDLY